jgi:hypothetical protein
MTIRDPSSRPPKAPVDPAAKNAKWASFRRHLVAILRLTAVPIAVTLAMILPDQLVKWGNFTTGPMALNNSEKTEILRKVFEKCGGSNWTVCENYDAERWAQDGDIYLTMVETMFERRQGGKLRKSIAQLFRPTYVRASFYESLSVDIKDCVWTIKIEASKADPKGGLNYMTFLTQFNENHGRECGFLYDAFAYPVFGKEKDSDPLETPVNRRIQTIESLTEAIAIRADSKIPAIGARLTAIERGTLDGLAKVCTADIPWRSRKLSDEIASIRSALYGFTNNRTSIRELEQAEEETARAQIKNILLTLISLLLIVLNAKTLGHHFNELWTTISHH